MAISVGRRCLIIRCSPSLDLQMRGGFFDAIGMVLKAYFLLRSGEFDIHRERFSTKCGGGAQGIDLDHQQPYLIHPDAINI